MKQRADLTFRTRIPTPNTAHVPTSLLSRESVHLRLAVSCWFVGNRRLTSSCNNSYQINFHMSFVLRFTIVPGFTIPRSDKSAYATSEALHFHRAPRRMCTTSTCLRFSRVITDAEGLLATGGGLPSMPRHGSKDAILSWPDRFHLKSGSLARHTHRNTHASADAERSQPFLGLAAASHRARW